MIFNFDITEWTPCACTVCHNHKKEMFTEKHFWSPCVVNMLYFRAAVGFGLSEPESLNLNISEYNAIRLRAGIKHLNGDVEFDVYATIMAARRTIPNIMELDKYRLIGSATTYSYVPTELLRNNKYCVSCGGQININNINEQCWACEHGI